MDEYNTSAQTAQDEIRPGNQHFKERQIQLIFSNALFALVFSMLNAAVLVLLVSPYPAPSRFYGWLIGIGTVLLLRFALVFAYRSTRFQYSPELWGALYTLGGGLMGLMWGISVPLFAPSLPPEFQSLLILMLGGIISTGSAFQASIYRCFVAFSVTIALPMILHLAFASGPTNSIAAALVVIFLILMLIVTWRMNRIITRSLMLDFKNKNLLDNLQKSEERFRTLTENSASAYFIIQDDRFTYLNPMGETIIGYTLEELQQRSFLDIVHPEHRERGRQQAEKRFAMQNDPELPQRQEFKLIRKDGETIWVDYTPGLMHLDGKPAILGTAFDITDKKRAEESMILSEKRFKMLFNMANDPMYLIELGENLSDARFKDVNNAACTSLGYTRDELLSMSPDEISAEDSPNLARAIFAKLSVDGKIVFETEHRTKNGDILPVEVSSHMAEFEGKTIIHSTTRDISLRKQLMEKLTELANTDSLTGCLNRRSFWSRGAAEMDRALRYDHPLVLLMLDIDHFKAINDTYGHSIGDVVLRSLVTTCQKELRTTDIFGRIGGEEFAALLVETDVAKGLAVAERIRDIIQQMTVSYGSQSVRCTVSIGVARFDKDKHSLDDLMKQADKALYHAKETGRDRVVSYDDVPS